MTHHPDTRLAELGISLPVPPMAVANYVPYVQSGSLVFVSGQLPFQDGALVVKGKLGAEVSLEEGVQAARLCAINLLAQAKAASGDLGRVRLLRLGAFVACTSDFIDHPKVVNGASDVMAQVLGDAGRHARAAVGVPSLPLDAAVEIEAVFEILPS